MTGYIKDGKCYHNNRWMPVVYGTFYGIICGIGRKHGYAIALHGTLVRDMDLVAVPWIPEAASADELVDALFQALDGSEVGKQCISKSEKPHGRVAYAIPTGGGGWIDLSVMPRVCEHSSIG